MRLFSTAFVFERVLAGEGRGILDGVLYGEGFLVGVLDGPAGDGNGSLRFGVLSPDGGGGRAGVACLMI